MMNGWILNILQEMRRSLGNFNCLRMVNLIRTGISKRIIFCHGDFYLRLQSCIKLENLVTNELRALSAIAFHGSRHAAKQHVLVQSGERRGYHTHQDTARNAQSTSDINTEQKPN